MTNLSTVVKVSERFQRSICIDTDMGDEATISSFICPRSSSEVLLSMAHGRQKAGEAAFTWTGPFGSGKSSLVVLLSALLGESVKLRNKAIKVVGEKNAKVILKEFNVTGRKGWTFVPVVGSRRNIVDAIGQAVRKSTGTRKKISSETLINAIATLAKNENQGLFIVIDEMGKFLEGAAEGNTDIYVLQQLAELAARSNGKIVILGVLHQAFAEYARRLSRDIRDEWSKIQGRYVDLPLNVAGEELVDLVSRAIKSDKKPKKSSTLAVETAKHIASWKHIHVRSLTSALSQCWPLHPVVSALLGPISRRRFGQNQRSVFGFLNSAEPYGFQDFIEGTDINDNALYEPARLWDYLKANLEPSIMASPDGHKWSLAVDALFRVEAVSQNEKMLDVLKCAALIDLFQERSGLVPEESLLSICLPNIKKKELASILKKLCSQSIICYRQHKKAYSLHQGSDFDIDAATEEAYGQVSGLDFEKIRSAARFQPLVAKKHYHKTGALRWFDVDLVPEEQATKTAKTYIPKDGACGLVMVVLGNKENADIEEICKKASESNSKWPVFVSAAQNAWIIRSHAKELQALEWIRSNNPALGGDTVARREVESRLAKVKDSMEEHLASALSGGQWFISGVAQPRLSLRELSSFISEKADSLYSASPKINSELVNRIKPSSNSVAALKTLLKAMTERLGEERLGIDGFPAEGGLFDTLLASTKMHKKNGKGWEFGEPLPKQDIARLRPLWSVADKFFKKNSDRVVPITELFAIWKEPPYGVKDGLLPFFALSYLLTRQQSYAVYHDSLYRPSIDDLLIDYLTKVPEEISLRVMNFSAVGQKILAGVSESLNRIYPELDDLSETSKPLHIARRLVMGVMNLHPWVLRTRQLSANAIKLRELVKNANDPNKVLFDDLPSLFKEYEQNLNRGDVLPIIEELDKSLNELISSYPKLIKDMKNQIFLELQIDGDNEKALKEVNLRAKNIMHVSGDFKLDAFSARLSSFNGSENEIEGLASLAADKPSRDWIDLDVNRARLRLAELSQQFNHAEAYGRVHNREDYRQAVAFMVGLNGTPQTFVHEFTIKKTQQKMVDAIEKKILGVLQKNNKAHQDLILAALANVGAKLLGEEEVKGKKRRAA